MNMKQIKKMMRQAEAMQKRMEEQMSSLTVEAASGGGMVQVKMDGRKNLTGIEINPDVVDPEDVEMLQDLITAAVNEAGRQVDEAMNQQLGGLAGGLMGDR